MVEGKVKIVRRSEDGAEQVLGLLGPGDVVGWAYEAELPTAFEAATDARLCLIPRADFETALERFPHLMQGYLRAVLNSLDRQRLWTATLRGRSATERLASWIAEAARDQAAPATRAIVAIALSQRDMSALLDMTPETFSRSLHQIANHRVIRLLSPNQIEVVNEAGLDAIAAGA